jgi:hypothetical protein
MKYLPNNLLIIALAMLLGISPLQANVESVCNSSDMSDCMHHQVNVSDSTIQADKDHLSTNDDSCDQNMCVQTHCSSTYSAIVFLDNAVSIAYTFSIKLTKAKDILVSLYPSSLYRPPKV